MAYIDDAQKLDLLWKKFQFGVSQTDPAKSPYEEYTASNQPVRTADIWKQDDLIPNPPAAVTGVVDFKQIQLIRDPSVVDGSTWICVESFPVGLTDENRLGDFIHPRYSPFYEIKVYKDLTRLQRVFNSKSETNWIFDYNTGILWFPQIEVLDITEVYIDAYRYVGTKGLPTLLSGQLIDTLLEPTSGSYEGGLVQGWVADETKLSDAVDQLNRQVLTLMPKPPKKLDEFEMKIPAARREINEANIVLSTDYTDSSGSIGDKPVPGNVIDRVVGMNLVSDEIGPFALGNEGVLSLELNGTSVGFTPLDYGSQVGTYGSLEIIADDTTAGSMIPFYQSLKAKAKNLNVPLGMSMVQMTHTTTAAGTAPLWLVRDSSMVKPTITANSVVVEDNAPVLYSSGVPHYGRGTVINLGASVDNLATDLHLDSRQLVWNTVPAEAGLEVWSQINANGLPSVLTKATPYSVTDVKYRIEDLAGLAFHGTVNFRVTAQNANGSTNINSTRKLNIMRSGSRGDFSPIDEAGIVIASDLGLYENAMATHAFRVALPAGPTPEVTFVSGSLPVWDSTQTVEAHEATIVGGWLRGDNTDYTEYFPSGPNYSTKNATQYATFAIQRKHVSQLKIEVEGSYSGLWIKLPGVTNQGLAPNGWMDCFANYEGYGVPGREVLNGCALGTPALGGAQAVTATFGYESSSNSVNNLILVRFRLNVGQQISGLRFSGVSYE